MTVRLQDLTIFEQVALAVTVILFGIYVLDPFFLERANALAPEARTLLRRITDIGRSNWMLIAAGSGIALALVLKRTHQGLRNEDVAEAVIFMLTRPANVTIRDLVMLPQAQDL